MHHIGLSISFQNVTPQSGGNAGTSTGTTAPDAAPSAPPAGGSMVSMLLPFLILVPFLFMMFRRNKKEAAQRALLKKGDRVVSTSGLIGELMELDERFAKVKLAPGDHGADAGELDLAPRSGRRHRHGQGPERSEGREGRRGRQEISRALRVL